MYTKINSWEDIFGIDGYTDSINPKEEKLKQVINKYELSTKGKCGLSNCGTPHFSGYIVETETGKLTNLGHVCGKKYFGTNFTVLKNKLDKEIDYLNKIKTINNAKLSIKSKADELVKIEKNWRNIETVYQAMLTEKLDNIKDRLELMVRQKSSVILVEHKASKSEIELEEARTGKSVETPFYITEKIGELMGLNYLAHRNIIEAMIFNINKEIMSIGKFETEDKTLKELNEMVKKIEHLGDHIDKANGLMSDGFSLFHRDNIEQLAQLAGKKKRRRFNRFLSYCF